MKITAIAPGLELVEAEIQHVAYLLWVEKGRPEGCDLETWLKAKELINHRRAPAKTAHRRTKGPASSLLSGKN